MAIIRVSEWREEVLRRGSSWSFKAAPAAARGTSLVHNKYYIIMSTWGCLVILKWVLILLLYRLFISSLWTSSLGMNFPFPLQISPLKALEVPFLPRFISCKVYGSIIQRDIPLHILPKRVKRKRYFASQMVTNGRKHLREKTFRGDGIIPLIPSASDSSCCWKGAFSIAQFAVNLVIIAWIRPNAEISPS